MGVLLVRHRYLNLYKSDSYKLGISLKRRYSPIWICYKMQKIRNFRMNILLSKFAGSSKIGSHGVLLVQHGYLNTYTSDFYKLGISLKRRYLPIRKC